MPTAEVNGTNYFYVDEGSGPLIVFGHGLLASSEMFRAQIDALKDRYRCVSVDWPGHGQSGHNPEGWTFWDLAADTATLVRDELDADEAIFVGLSQGGFAFMRLALIQPNLVRALVLMDTSAHPEPDENQELYRHLAESMRHANKKQRREIAEVVAAILYGEPFRTAHPDVMEHEKEIMLAHDPEGQYLADYAVLDRDDISGRVSEITAPTLVICGELDTATVPEKSKFLAANIPGAELVMIPGAGHHSAIENPEPVNEALEAFLARL